jgi:hypothetical protein
MKAVGVFTSSMINPKTISGCLETAAKTIAGATVISADFAALAEHGGESSRYDFGTAGVIRFETPQAESILRDAQEAIRRALIDGGFEAYVG